jgi:hypothetical protein
LGLLRRENRHSLGFRMRHRPSRTAEPSVTTAEPAELDAHPAPDASAAEPPSSALRARAGGSVQKPRPMTPAQAEAARRILASVDGLIRPFPGCHWSTERTWRAGAWSTRVLTVRAMQTHGWLERTRQRADSWLDPRRLTDAGKAALARVGGSSSSAGSTAGSQVLTDASGVSST